ncbi:MAG: hypothetical protein ACRET1_10315 [Burkholderiales bacterium]
MIGWPFQCTWRRLRPEWILWVTDLLPDEMESPIAQMVEAGSIVIEKTLESAFERVK